jgi:hypothetical protein
MGVVYGYSRLVQQVTTLADTVKKICDERTSDQVNSVATRVAIASIQADLTWIKQHIALSATAWPHRPPEITGGK